MLSLNNKYPNKIILSNIKIPKSSIIINTELNIVFKFPSSTCFFQIVLIRIFFLDNSSCGLKRTTEIPGILYKPESIYSEEECILWWTRKTNSNYILIILPLNCPNCFLYFCIFFYCQVELDFMVGLEHL